MKNLKLLLILLFSTFSYAQTIESLIKQNNLKLSEVENFIKQNNLQIPIDGCVDFPNPDYKTINSNYSKSTQRKKQNETQHVFNVYFHVINKNNGTREIPIGENEIMDAVALLNINYNPINIFFKYIGHSAINDSNWTTVRNSTAFNNLRTYAIANDYYVKEAFNIFICEEYVPGAGVAFKPGTMSLIEDEDLLNSTLQHEIAHNFLIHHIDRATNICEYVDGTNSDTTGDLVIDTNAAHKLVVKGADNIVGTADDEVVYSNGIYTYNNFKNNRVDCINTPYRNVQILNYMATNTYLGIRESFTNGQEIRMRETIENNLMTTYANVQNNISSLYEPYYSVILGAEGNENIYSTKDDTKIPGNILICRNPVLIKKFQKGFDYDFYTFDNWDYVNTPTNTVFDFSKTANDYIIIENKNRHAVKINQINNNNIKGYTNLGRSKGHICKSEPATSGKIISKTNFGSYNFHIKDLNEKEVINPNLEQELESGKYHTIQKTTKSGITTQRTIYKNH
jgi:hypothetical protein